MKAGQLADDLAAAVHDLKVGVVPYFRGRARRGTRKGREEGGRDGSATDQEEENHSGGGEPLRRRRTTQEEEDHSLVDLKAHLR